MFTTDKGERVAVDVEKREKNREDQNGQVDGGNHGGSAAQRRAVRQSTSIDRSGPGEGGGRFGELGGKFTVRWTGEFDGLLLLELVDDNQLMWNISGRLVYLLCVCVCVCAGVCFGRSRAEAEVEAGRNY